VTFDLLGNRRRRHVVHHLCQRDEPVQLKELAARLAAWETGKPVEELSRGEQKRVRTALQQFHLPKMAELGFVEHDAERGTVAPTGPTTELSVYPDVSTGADRPWWAHYLALSVLFGALQAGVATGTLPLPGPSTLAALFAVAVGVSGLVQGYVTAGRFRLGSDAPPPEAERG